MLVSNDEHSQRAAESGREPVPAALVSVPQEIGSSCNTPIGSTLSPSIPRRTHMTTSSGHTTAILASKVKGTAVYNDTGDKIGTVEDIVLDKTSNQIMFAALGFGGLMGIGEKYYPIPWSLLNYNEDKGGYVVPLDKARIENAPAYDLKDLTKHDGSLGGIREKTYSYYKVNRDWQ
jgi:sporulation protein YlmC with PRC-barrel domain